MHSTNSNHANPFLENICIPYGYMPYFNLHAFTHLVYLQRANY